MTVQLQPFQRAAARRIYTALTKGKRPLLVAPTAAGKTVIAASAVREFVTQNRGAKVWWLAHSAELQDQAVDALTRAGLPASRFTRDQAEGIRIATSVVMRNHRQAIGDVDLLVVDEAHRAMAKTYRDAIGMSARVLGLTATPVRLDGQPLGELFDTPIVAASAQELVDVGMRSDVRLYTVSEDDYKRLRRGLGNDIETKAAQSTLGKRMVRLGGNIVAEVEKRAGGRAVLVFASTIAQARDLDRRLRDAGRKSRMVHAGIPKPDRTAVRASLESGAIDTIVNVNVYQEGFDCAAIGCVVLARPTSSRTVYLQQVGRVTRHKNPVVLDFAGNAHRLGHPTDSQVWNGETFWEPTGEFYAGRTVTTGRAFGGESAVRRCPSCSLANRRDDETCRLCGASLATMIVDERFEMALQEYRRVVAEIRERGKSLPAEVVEKAERIMARKLGVDDADGN